MSSHHIVREKQEPALLILNLTGFDPEHLGQLLEWSPTVLTVGAEAERLYAWGVHVDYLLDTGEANNIPQAGLQYINTASQNPLTAGMDFLIGREYPAVNIITTDFSPDLYQHYPDQITMIVFRDNQKVYAIKSGFEKWKPAGSKFHVYTKSHDVTAYNMLDKGSSLWEVITDGFIKVEFSQPYLFIAEEI